MRWLIGTRVFDAVVTSIVDNVADTGKQAKLIFDITKALEDMDWDCHFDSKYRDHQSVQQAWHKLHPDWDLDTSY